MLSFIDLPPEIRLAIYRLVLPFPPDKHERILYSNKDYLRCENTQIIRHKRSFPPTKTWTRRIYANHLGYTMYHHADIGKHLILASTCRLLRADLLALTWSDVDIQFQSPELYGDLHYVFYDRLSGVTCSFIRSLQFDVDERISSPSQTKEIAGFVRRRLPGLEQLTVIVIMSFESFNRHQKTNRLTPCLATLGILPLRVAIKFRYHTTYHPMGQSSWARNYAQWRPHATPNYHNPHERAGGCAATALRALQTELSLTGQKRREEQAKRKSEDQVCDILEDTVEMRSLLVGCTGRM